MKMLALRMHLAHNKMRQHSPSQKAPLLRRHHRTSTNLSDFKGEIDELKIFNTLLESSQIEELFINPRRGLIAYYPFNADNGTSHPLLDLSGQDNDLRGSPSLVDGFSGSSKAIKGSVSTPVFNLDNYSIT